MLLSDSDILDLKELHQDLIVPWDDAALQPASYDLSLGSEIIFSKKDIIWPKSRKFLSSRKDLHAFLNGSESFGTNAKNGVTLRKGDFVLGTTIEKVNVPDNIGARFEGKSSLGRIGLMTHITAGFIDPGFEGSITVEICNVSDSNIVLEYGMKIGQICFYEMKTRSLKPYGQRGNHYQGQSGTTQSFLEKMQKFN